MFHSIYKDFLRFLDALETEGAWEAYTKYYYDPHKEFLDSYWRTFRWMDLHQIQQRVTKVKKQDYSTLVRLLSEIDLENTVKNVLAKCTNVLEIQEEPAVYFMVGFFSADGFVLEHKGKPVIGFGLERFKSWRLLPLLFAHEYAHFLRHVLRSDEPYICDGVDGVSRSLLSEGISMVFSEVVFPEYALNDHLFLSRERLLWCQENDEYLRDLVGQALKGEWDVALVRNGDAKIGVPPRVGNYIGYNFVKRFLEKQGVSRIHSLLSLRDFHELVD
ncbi:MAG: hypothetical protein JSV84_03185 [Gemmatimonadota bacterium]|nr:MAG: hypothetical protein JSV84_03185 [Gemmatimonadota bacterium]